MPVRDPQRSRLRAATAVLVLIAGAVVRAAEAEPPPAAQSSPVPEEPQARAAEAPPAPPSPRPASGTRSTATAGADRAPVELPAFRSGLWEYRRTVVRAGATRQQVSSVKRCGDPGADMRAKMESLKKQGCQFAPLKRSNDRYISSWTCQTRTGAMRFRDVLQAKDPDGYQDVSETHTRQHVTEQKIEAKRIGDCPGMGSGAPPTPTRKPPARHP